MGNKRFGMVRIHFAILGLILAFNFLDGQEQKDSSGLADIFVQSSESKPSDQVVEVEPIVVGRDSWDQTPGSKTNDGDKKEKLSANLPIGELDAIETKQANFDRDGLPLLPPKVMPAVNLNRNFEGTLVLQPRKLGFIKSFPYQLENSSGKRIAYVDTQGVRSVNPLQYNGKRVNLLGKLEPIEPGSKKLVIRAKIIRLIE
tara:strand:+ start:76 stop:678 length:603 start_codon:yes stop_codon:yes gene_type:complete